MVSRCMAERRKTFEVSLVNTLIKNKNPLKLPRIQRKNKLKLPVLFTDKLIIPAGADIVLAILGVHLDPAIYPNPLTWNPHNFDPDEEAQRPKSAFVSFSLGPRGCLGTVL